MVKKKMQTFFKNRPFEALYINQEAASNQWANPSFLVLAA
jgi:hypothetical protein